MDPNILALRKLQALLNKFSLVTRHHSIPGTDKNESDTDHTLSVALLAWQLQTTLNLPLSSEKILKYALAHDLVEAYAGDVNTFASQKERAEKVLKEKTAFDRIVREHPEFTDLHETIEAYEKREDDEALFVWTIDKMQALILGDLDSWRPYKTLSISYGSFCEKYDELLASASPHAKRIYESLYEYCKGTYYDKP